MDKPLFEDLMQSLHEAIAIAKGEMQPSRVFVIEPETVNAHAEQEKLQNQSSTRQ